MSKGVIIIANQRIPVEADVVTWETSGWNARIEQCIATKSKANPFPECRPMRRWSYRPKLAGMGDKPSLAGAQAVIRQFVIHHDGVENSDSCFHVLHNERNLSCHFLLDWDGTIYQTLDLAFAAWHAAAWNPHSIGIELANRGDAKAWPDYYGRIAHRGPARERRAIQINRAKILSYDFTPAQKASFGKLALALQRVLPNLPLEFPQASPGVPLWGTLPQIDSHAFAGYVGHYHLTEQKWDPGPFDFTMLKRLRGRFSMPIFWEPPKAGDIAPYVPDEHGALVAASAKLDAIALDADAGYFPVGPWGESRLWHGGLHLAGSAGQPVFAPFPGRVVAARMGADTAIGSTNFVLLRHDLALGPLKTRFFSLHMHLADATKSASPPAWLAESTTWKSDYKPGAVILLDEPVLAAAHIGEMGSAGPDGHRRVQLHFEIFSTGDLFSSLPNTPWDLVDGTTGGRFSDLPRIDQMIDTNHDQRFERSELATFFAGGGAGQTRNFVTFHVSEWTADPSWNEALRVPADFKDIPPSEIDAMVAEQITPGLWWDARVAKHAKLPPDGVVYHYHPIAFIAWFNEQLLLNAQPAAAIDPDATSKVPTGITDDRYGEGMGEAPEATTDPCNQGLTLEKLSHGFDEPDCP